MKKLNKSKLAVIYCRNAARNQVGQNRAIESQAEKCLAQAEIDGCKVIRTIKEIGSGMNQKRKGIQELIKLVKNNKVDVVYATDVCRLSRNFGNLEFLKELFKEYEVELKLISKIVGSTLESKLADKMIAIFTEYQKNLRAKKRLLAK